MRDTNSRSCRRKLADTYDSPDMFDDELERHDDSDWDPEYMPKENYE